MVLKFIDIYNKVAEQAWSMYDSEVESRDEFESGLTSSIQKALSDLWCSYPYPFRVRIRTITTKAGQSDYDAPNGDIFEISDENNSFYDIKIENGNYLEFFSYPALFSNFNNNLSSDTGIPKNFSVFNDKIYFTPIPDKEYTIKCAYLTLCAGKDKSGKDIFNLANDDDYIDIPEKYEDLFLQALITKSMFYSIASQTDENYSGYKSQYISAYSNLINSVNGIKKYKKVVV